MVPHGLLAGDAVRLGLPLPKQVFAHGWWTADGRKMSKIDWATSSTSTKLRAVIASVRPGRAALLPAPRRAVRQRPGLERGRLRQVASTSWPTSSATAQPHAEDGRTSTAAACCRAARTRSSRSTDDLARASSTRCRGSSPRRTAKLELQQCAPAAGRTGPRGQRLHRRDRAVQAGQGPGEGRAARHGAEPLGAGDCKTRWSRCCPILPEKAAAGLAQLGVDVPAGRSPTCSTTDCRRATASGRARRCSRRSKPRDLQVPPPECVAARGECPAAVYRRRGDAGHRCGSAADDALCCERPPGPRGSGRRAGDGVSKAWPGCRAGR